MQIGRIYAPAFRATNDPMPSAGAREHGRFAGRVAVATAAVGAAVVWQRYHSGTPDPALLGVTDLATYYYPITDVVGRHLAAGELPLWNPASCSGIPLLATLQPAVLYPFTWLAALLPTADAMFYGLWMQVVLAGSFTAAALRAGGMHWAASGLGGVLYVHACLLGNLAWPPSVATMTWLPLLWLCIEKLARGLRIGWWVALAVGAGLQLLAGFPQYLVYGYYWLVPYAVIVLYAEAAGAERFRRGGMMVLAVALGVGLAAAQLLPTAELAGESARAGGLSPAEVHYLDSGTRPIGRVLANVVDPRPKNLKFELGAGAGYLGIASVLCVIAMLWFRGRSLRTLYLAVAASLALLLSDGFYGIASPLYGIYHDLPTGGLFRTPERLRFITMICAIVLACGGLDALLRAGRDRRRIVLLLLLCCGAVAATLLGGAGVWWRALVASALAVFLLFGPSGRFSRSAAAGAWVLFTLFDLWLATVPAGVLHAYPKEISERYHAMFRKAVIKEERLDEIRATTEFGRIEPYGFVPFHAAGSAYGLHRPICYEPLAPGQWRSLSEVLLPDQVLSASLANPPPEEQPHFYDVAAVATIVRAQRGIRVETNDDALPRAYLVGRAMQATQEEAFAHIRDGSFDFHRGVLLEEKLPTGPASPAAFAPVTIVSYQAQRVEILTNAEREAWLVLADTFYPGWEARIDGEATPILRANGLYRAVRVGAGPRTIIFSYRPMSFGVGLALSGVSAAAILAIAMIWRGRRRSRGPSAESGGRIALASR